LGKAHFRNKFWFLDYKILKAKDVSTMANCLARLEGKAKVLPVPAGKVIADTTFGFWTNLFPAGKVIADTTFGFWTNLFITDYEVGFWRPIIHHVFTHALRASLTRKAVYARLDPMRFKLRNRISHYEPI